MRLLRRPDAGRTGISLEKVGVLTSVSTVVLWLGSLLLPESSRPDETTSLAIAFVLVSTIQALTQWRARVQRAKEIERAKGVRAFR